MTQPDPFAAHFEQQILRANPSTVPSRLAGAIAGQVRLYGHATVRAIGAQAVNQSVKAIAVAVKFLALDGIAVGMIPSFVNVDVVDGGERTAVMLEVRKI